MTPRAKRALIWGALLYTVTSAADAILTLRGLDGDLSLEGNAFLRDLMKTMGPLNALIAVKVAVGLFGIGVAAWGYPAIKRQDRWTIYLALTPWTRRWMSSGDRAWIAFIPLYGSAIVWGLAALSWATLFWMT